MMKKWMVGLKGWKDVLDSLSYLVDSNSLRVHQEGETHYFESAELDVLENEDAVRNYMVGFLSTFNGVGKAAIDGYQNIELSGEIVGVQEDGRRHVFRYVSASTDLVVRGSVDVADGTKPVHPTDAEAWLNISMTDPVAARILQMLAVANDWVTLYVVLDFIEQNVGGGEKQLRAKQIITSEDAAQLKRFTGTANNFNVLGLSARHGITKWEPPANPMTLEEAKATIRHLVVKWLLWKATS